MGLHVKMRSQNVSFGSKCVMIIAYLMVVCASCYKVFAPLKHYKFIIHLKNTCSSIFTGKLCGKNFIIIIVIIIIELWTTHNCSPVTLKFCDLICLSSVYVKLQIILIRNELISFQYFFDGQRSADRHIEIPVGWADKSRVSWYLILNSLLFFTTLSNFGLEKPAKFRLDMIFFLLKF